jgi:general secretion pathway protein I
MEASMSGARRNSEQGFTLIEMMVALAIFSLAALALLRLGGATAANSARLREQAIAQIVADNLAVETLTDPAPPTFGIQTGEAVNAGRRWVWTRRTGRSPEARIQQIEISVANPAGGPGRANLTIFRRALP